MAALIFIEHWEERSGVVEDVFAAAREAELNRQREYDAALHIQAVMRGVRLRQFIKYLHMCAIRIQMAWRGYLGRIEYHRQLAAKVEQRQLNNYHNMATKIKKVWKGHYVRKNVYDYYAMKTYLGALEEKNKIVRERLREYEQEMKEREALEAEVKELEKYDKYARSCHYMMSTRVKAGVFVKEQEVSVFEDQIKAVFPKDLGKKKNKWHKSAQKTVDNSTFELPPLKRVQGPFKNPSVVYMQRLKSLKPTLKVQTT
ncbi:spermatogenesis-associated protein 17-like [Bolinopsis microptera]|uniref:spermatogenesis-associated protein 17-like n=1 Tax=Bolinopsis microptera TaxID=2820187 RepID=UPI003079206D